MAKKKENTGKKGLAARAFLIYFCFALAGIAVIVRITYIWIAEGSTLRQEAEKEARGYFNIEAQRGRILSKHGDILVQRTSMFDVYMDTYPIDPIDTARMPLMSNADFIANIGPLADSLHLLFPEKTAAQWEKYISDARKKENRYLKIKTGADIKELERMKKFPLFVYEYTNKQNSKQRRTSLNYTHKETRLMPFGDLASRTIGYVSHKLEPRDTSYIDAKTNKEVRKVYDTIPLHVGIEGAFDEYLQYTRGRILYQKLGVHTWGEVKDESNIYPRDGKDVVTTFDMAIQDVAHKALRENIIENKAQRGCAIVMEVATGEILAMVNLRKDKNGNYREIYNDAIGRKLELGSVFKTPSLLVALNDEKISPDSRFPVTKRSENFPGRPRPITDSHGFGDGNPTVREIFEHSSNIGSVKAIYENYKNDQQAFIDGLYRFGLNEPLGLPLSGEASPYLKNTADKTWSKATITSIPMGYEVEITPLQLLTFYNAIANNGCMIKPKFVTEIRENGETIKAFPTDTLNPKICSDKALSDIRSMLEGVVLRGTGRRGFQGVKYTVAGKTGTSRVSVPGAGYASNKHNASFCGYFPADNPKYSCIVVVEEPSAGQYYAAAVALPVFRDIANKLYAVDKELMPEADATVPKDSIPTIPMYANARKASVKTVLDFIGFDVPVNDSDDEWISISTDTKNKEIKVIPDTASYTYNVVPAVEGMSLTDAVYVLEAAGLSVEATGYGKVAKQLPVAGTAIGKNKKVRLSLKI